MPSAAAEQNVGAGPCRGETCGDMLEAMARIAPSQLNGAMARVAPRNGTISLDLSYRVKISEQSFWTGFESVLGGPNRYKKRIGLGCSKKWVACDHHAPKSTILRSDQQRFFLDPPPVV